jgi:cytochrome o ubiquinol oxidase operon protein cyoD
MNQNPIHEGQAPGNTASYVAGFVLSLLLTLTAYWLVLQHKNSHQPLFSHRFLIITIVVLAITQLFVQLVFFLHLDSESKPRWNLLVASFAAIVVLILVLGSLWIMNNLNYHMDSPAQTDKNIIQDEGVHP